MKPNRITSADCSIKAVSSRLTPRQLLRKVRKQPEDALLLASLADAYLAEGAYVKALEVSSKAYTFAPTNPLVLWDHARALYMNRRFTDAVILHKEILKKQISIIARSMHWSDETARQFRNTSRFDLALCYIQLDKLAWAAGMLRDYISQCGREACYYSRDLACVKLRSLERLRRQAERRSIRLWISFLEVKALPTGRRTKYKRGFTNGLAMARTRSEAITALRASLAEVGYELIRAEGTEEFDRRMLKTELPDSARKLAEEVRKDNAARFADFCMYPSKAERT